VVVYGGGETGCETAELLAERGARVTLVTRSAATKLARGAEPGYRKFLRRRLAARSDVRIVERTRIEAVDDDRVRLVDEAGGVVELGADRIYVAQGRVVDASLVATLHAAGVAAAAVGDARRIARIGDAVHDAHRSVRTLVVEVLERGGGADRAAPADERPRRPGGAT
jgi:pyruvate/2-oxoglutarate dehydrogenase complex dihydrolipoamide dehydrogenase (E3) component